MVGAGAEEEMAKRQRPQRRRDNQRFIASEHAGFSGQRSVTEEEIPLVPSAKLGT